MDARINRLGLGDSSDEEEEEEEEEEGGGGGGMLSGSAADLMRQTRVRLPTHPPTHPFIHTAFFFSSTHVS